MSGDSLKKLRKIMLKRRQTSKVGAIGDAGLGYQGLTHAVRLLVITAKLGISQ